MSKFEENEYIKTQITIGKKQSGKTTKLIKRAAEEDLYILTSDKYRASCIFSICKKVNDLFYIYGRDKFIRWITGQIYTFINPKDVFSSWENKQFPEFSSDDKAVLDQKQKDIDIYIDEKDKQLVQKTDSFGNIYMG